MRDWDSTTECWKNILRKTFQMNLCHNKRQIPSEIENLTTKHQKIY